MVRSALAIERSATAARPASVGQLPSEEREILVAHVWGGLSIRQIATAFELSRSTVHRRYTSAIEQLRNELEVMNDSSKES